MTVSKTNINFNGWNGCGYIITNPETGAGAYMISGGLNGAIIMTYASVVTTITEFGVAWENIYKFWLEILVNNNPADKINSSALSPFVKACGSGWSEFVVPDNLFGWYSFNMPCQIHDSCYENCETTKEQCDSSFLKDMLNVCNTLTSDSYWKKHCEGTSYIYYSAVRDSADAISTFENSNSKCIK